MKNRLLMIATCLSALTGVAAPAPEPLQISLNARVRYEGVQQSGLRDADALTLRTRVGLGLKPMHGWTALLEAENIAPFDGNAYSQAGLNPGGTGRAAVPDPEGTELNQAWLAYTGGKTTATLGRQRLVLDNARFVGDSGWRQNMQTFDGVVVQDHSLTDTVLTYAWLNRINRVLGDRHPQGHWRSDSHLLNASHVAGKAGTVTGYAYWLDFAGVAKAQSCATYGVSFTGGAPLAPDLKLIYRVEIATQADYGRSTLNYRADYRVIELGFATKPGALTLGHEVLGAGNGVGFKTPLATMHAFNGWADIFSATPATGLRDTYLKASVNLPGGVSLLAFQHWFAADEVGPDPGREFNLQLSRKLGAHVTAVAKYADFRHDSTAWPQVQKVWLQLDFAY